MAILRLSSFNMNLWFYKQTMRSFASFTNGKYVTCSMKGDVAVVKFDNPDEKVNSLSEQVSKEADTIMREVQSQSDVNSVVLISGKPSNFIVGADIRMIERCKSANEAENLSKDGQDVMNRVEQSRKPVVAAIMGQCLGGGAELALACQYRIAVKNKKTVLGFPEVLLGLLPGAGGTQRLPRLISLPESIGMMLTGKSVRADKCKKIGLVDQLVDELGPGLKPADERTLEYLEEVAVQTAKNIASGQLKINRKRPLVERLMSTAFSNQWLREKVVFDKARATVMKTTGGLYPAPLRILDVVKTSFDQGLTAGYQAERKGFGELSQTSHSKSLIGLFHGQTLCKKNRYGKVGKKVDTISVLGAGLMGAGITAVSIDKGYNVILKDMSEQGLERGEQQIRSIYDGYVKRKRLTPAERDVCVSRVLPTLNYGDIKNSDIIIEAVFEDIAIKHKVVKEVEAQIRPDCIFASNTSALPIAKVAEASKRPENVVGMHYFSPVDKMQLLELITHDKTSKETIATAVDVGLKQGKVCIVVKDSPGFYTTRLIAFLMSEAYRLLQEGVEPKRLDKLTKAYGWPVGAATLMDEVGMDVGAHIGVYLQSVFKERIKGGTMELGQDMMASKFHGRKSGKGWYLYPSDGKKKGPREVNQAAIDLLKKHSLKPLIENTDENVQMRLITRFVNEAVLCLEEGVLDNPLEGDIGAVFGLGFPPFLGGPFRFIDHFGADRFISIMHKYRDAYGPEFEPCQTLLDFAKDKSKKFHVSKS